MANSHCLSGLVAKRAELAGEIKLLEQFRSDVPHVDATSRIMDPAFELDAIVPKVRRPRHDWFGNGELLGVILETLRKAQEPLTSREITAAVMRRRASTSTAGRRRGWSRSGWARSGWARCCGARPALVEKVAYGPRALGWHLAACAT